MKTTTIEIINAGLGTGQFLSETGRKFAENVENWKNYLISSFNTFKEKGEMDVSEGPLKLKVNVAWALVNLSEFKNKITGFSKAKD
ncbi:MAG: hypothetical protein H7A25_00810 [Leptospiraceae bacterium]|nr:hypothetical protein [Leptospiraceae bacterium]MCP5498417.1 hypothetical protein [Leptospiraceae bacterium]